MDTNASDTSEVLTDTAEQEAPALKAPRTRRRKNEDVAEPPEAVPAAGLESYNRVTWEEP